MTEPCSVKISTGEVVLGALSSATTAIHTIVIKNAIKGTENMTGLVYYTSLFSAAALLPVMLLNGEVACLHSLQDFRVIGECIPSARFFCLAVCCRCGCFSIGFMLNVGSFFQIQVTSPVTHVISSSARSVLPAFIAVALFHNTLTAARGGSILVITIGSALYTFVKHQDTKKLVETIQRYTSV
ncbi:hypothetical protein BDZ88DRAFT_400360 [Geranomyces variabilis]|nr:hypothetical protein BDZ88DRAFT_400360 [Geranomyces variabilis]